MKKLFIIALACYGLRVAAQLPESRNFLYLYSDSIVYAGDIKFRPDFSGNLRLSVDSRKVPTTQVKFFNSKDGFFANTRKMGVLRKTEFAERIMEGRINVFQERILTYSPFVYGTQHVHKAPFVQSTSPSIDVSMYYNRGYGDLKKLNYHNLKQDMSDNLQSMDMLYAYRRNRNTANLFYAAAGTSVLAALITLVGNAKNTSSMNNYTVGASLGVVGLGFVAGGYLNTLSANRKLEGAIDIYNK